MTDQDILDRLAFVYSGRTREAFDAAPHEWRQRWYDDVEPLVAEVRQLMAQAVRESVDAYVESELARRRSK